MTENNAQPIITINNDASMSIQVQSLSIGEILQLLDAARSAVLSTRIQQAQPVADEALEPLEPIGELEQ